MLVVSYAVEGWTDEPVAERLLRFAGAEPRKAITAHGKTRLDSKIAGLNRACASSRAAWLILRDLDRDDDGSCPPAVVDRLLGGDAASPSLVLRLPVRSIESWLMADRDGIAEAFKVPVSRVPTDPDAEADPKRRLVALCRASRSSTVRDGMVPRPSAQRTVGPRYEELIHAFARDEWDLKRARTASASLHRSIDRIVDAITTGRWR